MSEQPSWSEILFGSASDEPPGEPPDLNAILNAAIAEGTPDWAHALKYRPKYPTT